METLKQITQSHLSILALDKNSHNPIAHMPVYAEISVTETKPPYTIGRNEFPIHLQNQVADLVRALLPLHLDETQFRSLSPGLREKLVGRLADLLVGDQSPIQHPEQEWKAIIDKAIIQALTELDLPATNQEVKTSTYSYPLGYLATDHVGYASFDIRKFNENSISTEINIEKREFVIFVYPYGKQANQINALIQGRLTNEAVFAKLEIPADMRVMEDMGPTNLHSMQNPSLIDWYLSPSSFSVNPSYFIGEDGCENLFPANFATQEFRFFQIVRGNALQVPDGVPKIRVSSTLEYVTTWQPLGHTLGSIIYSLPLAPGEIVKIAIIDWARKSKDSRDEDLTVKEQLAHNTQRDRTISETVEAALREWQRGGSIMGGNSGGAGLSLAYGPIGVAAGNAHSFGGAYSTSSGDRSITASTVQQASDAFAQHSASFRELRSTIVVQSDQKEFARAETRVVANHNHSHALTMLYYEVLRHYKVTTEFMRMRSSLMVDYSSARVYLNNEHEIIRYRKILESVLLDERFSDCFAAVQKYLCAIDEVDFQFDKKHIVDEANLEFTEYRLTFQTGDDEFDLDDDVFFDLHTTVGLKRCKDSGTNDVALHRKFEQGSTETISVKSDSPLKWIQIQRFQISVQSRGDETWFLKRVSVEGKDTNNEYHILFSDDINIELEDDGANPYVIRDTRKPIVAETKQNPLDKLSEEDRCCVNKLKKHLVENSDYYNRAIWLLEDPNGRASRFEGITVNGKSLLDWIENRPLDVLGNYVVFPADPEIGGQIEKPKEAKVEKLIALPTRGVFGEAKLGHCNASEIVDNTRFWDWQTSPIPEQAPEIKEVSTDSRNVTQNLTPSQLPNSIVNIVNPSNLPDPTGMANALTLLGKADIFRDMSMGKEVNDLLKKLSDNSVSFAEAANKAREILANEEIAKAKASADAQKAAQGQKNSNDGSMTPQQFMDWMNATKHAPITNEEKKGIQKEIAGGAKKSVNPKPAMPAIVGQNPLMLFRLHTQSDQILHVSGTWDYEVHHDGVTDFEKLWFFDGVAQYSKSKITSDGAVVLKGDGQISAVIDRGLLTKIPGLPPQTGTFFFSGNGTFKYDKNASSITFDVVAATKRVTAEVFVEVGGQASVKFSEQTGGNIEIVKITAGREFNAEVNGKAGTKVNYEIEYLTAGLTIKQNS